MDWKLAEAKNKLSEVVRLAIGGEPQKIKRRDDAVVVISEIEFERLQNGGLDFKEFLFNAPDLSQLDLERNTEELRELEL